MYHPIYVTSVPFSIAWGNYLAYPVGDAEGLVRVSSLPSFPPYPPIPALAKNTPIASTQRPLRAPMGNYGGMVG